MKHIPNQLAQLKDETADTLTHLASATGDGSRRMERQARQRLHYATKALRGQQPRRLRWLALGMMAGFAVAAAVTALVGAAKASGKGGESG